MIFARKSFLGGYYMVNEHGHAVDPDGNISYHPWPCEKGEYPEYKEPIQIEAAK